MFSRALKEDAFFFLFSVRVSHKLWGRWGFFHFRKIQLEMVNLLINLGVDLNQSGWIKFQDVWLFGTPIELAFYFKRESRKEIFLKMWEILSNTQLTSWNNMDENSKFTRHLSNLFLKNLEKFSKCCFCDDFICWIIKYSN